MAKNKKIYFYKFSINEKNPPNPKFDSFSFFKTIPNFKENEPFTYKLIDDKEKTLVEILFISENYVFGRIGKEDDLNYMHFRSNDEKNKIQNIKVPKNNYAEKFTYFYLNFSTNILAFLSILGAPSFGKFKRFINQLCSDIYESKIIAVCNSNIINTLRTKDRVSGFIVKTTIPVDEFLGINNLGLDRNSFVDLENASEVSIELNLIGKRNLDISNKHGINNPVFNLLENIRKRPNRIATKVKANNKNEKTNTYDLDEEIYTYCIEMPKISNEENFSKEIKKSIISAYNDCIGEILKMAR